VLLEALSGAFDVDVLSHELAMSPRWRERAENGHRRITIGVQPVTPHVEGVLAGLRHEGRLGRWSCAWAVNSRYAGALAVANVPFAIWEPTTMTDELSVIDPLDVRRSGTGRGVGTLLHRSILPLARGLEGWVYRRAKATFAMSEYTRQRMIHLHRLQPNEVSVLTHPPSREFSTVLDQEMPLTGTRVPGLKVLFVGRADDPRKGFDLLLTAWRIVRQAIPQATLSVVGPHSPSWRAALGEIDGLGLTFFGRITTRDLARAYLTHDLLVVPSKQEGFGIVVAEAFHTGLPVVSTTCGGPEAVIRESGGGVLTPQDAEAFGKAIVMLLKDDATRIAMADRGRRYACQVLGFDAFAKRVRDITCALPSGAVAPL
jgi:glycosyltransferase involved in cell wall biosynthesis